MAGKLKGKKALVTGAARRIGRSICLALAAEGVDIVAHYNRSEKEVLGLCSELKGLGVGAWPVSADFAQAGEYGTLIERAMKAAGGLDILVNNASIFPESRLDDLTLDGLVKNIEVNSWVPFVLSRDFAKAVGSGSIINMVDSRVQGYDWGHVGYILSKHVLLELTKMTAIQYAPGIRVNGVNPGLILPPPGKDASYMERLVKTVPLKKHGSPEEIAAAVVFLAGNDFVTGEVLSVDGGRHIMEYKSGPHPD